MRLHSFLFVVSCLLVINLLISCTGGEKSEKKVIEVAADTDFERVEGRYYVDLTHVEQEVDSVMDKGLGTKEKFFTWLMDFMVEDIHGELVLLPDSIGSMNTVVGIEFDGKDSVQTEIEAFKYYFAEDSILMTRKEVDTAYSQFGILRVNDQNFKKVKLLFTENQDSPKLLKLSKVGNK